MRRSSSFNERPACLKNSERVDYPEWSRIVYRRKASPSVHKESSRHGWLVFVVKELAMMFIHVLVVVSLH